MSVEKGSVKKKKERKRLSHRVDYSKANTLYNAGMWCIFYVVLFSFK